MFVASSVGVVDAATVFSSLLNLLNTTHPLVELLSINAHLLLTSKTLTFESLLISWISIEFINGVIFTETFCVTLYVPRTFSVTDVFVVTPSEVLSTFSVFEVSDVFCVFDTLVVFSVFSSWLVSSCFVVSSFIFAVSSPFTLKRSFLK